MFKHCMCHHREHYCVNTQCVYLHSSVRLQPQFNSATQSDNCSYPSLHAGEKIGLLGRSMSHPGTLGGAVPISTSGNRNTSGWPLYVTSCLGIRERWCTKSEEKLHLCTLRIWCTWSLHKLDAWWRSCLRWFRRKDAGFLLPAHGPGEKSCAERKNPIRWNIYMQEGCDYQSNTLGALIRLWEIRSGQILVRLRCIHAS